ncbi:hypothetical protein V1514DRAFT_288222 [Lipomyces japonicus]|uniref:uncharacterized protein n=1 Tax=Lipomyces japonicus TaxID=56871 RepID=UPI0034CE4492
MSDLKSRNVLISSVSSRASEDSNIDFSLSSSKGSSRKTETDYFEINSDNESDLDETTTTTTTTTAKAAADTATTTTFRTVEPARDDYEFNVPTYVPPSYGPSSGRFRLRLLFLKNLFEDWFHANTGLLLVAFSQMFNSSMNLFTKLLVTSADPPFHALQIVFTRMSITAAVCLIYMWYTAVPDFFLGPKGIRKLLWLRGFVGFFGLFGIYYSLTYLSLSDATVITFLAPTVAGFACSVFLHEPFGRIELLAGLISLTGVILIAQPTPTLSGNKKASTGQRLGAVAVALLGVLGAAGAYTTIRLIGKRAHPLISVNYFAMICTVISTIALIAVPGISFVFPHTLGQWILLIMIGICGFCFQFMLTAGLQREKAGRAGNMVYLQMLFAFTFEKIFWKQSPGWTEIVGSGIILSSALYVAVSKRRTESSYDKVQSSPVGGDLEANQELVGSQEEIELSRYGVRNDA